MKYKAVFLRKIGEYKKKVINKDTKAIVSLVVRPNFVRVGTKKFNPTDEYITFQKDSSYPIQLEAYSEQNGNTLIYYYDYDNMNLIGLDTLLEYKMKPKDLNKVTGKKIVEQIVAGAKQVQGNPLIYILLPLGIGIGMLILGYWMGGGFNAPTATA